MIAAEINRLARARGAVIAQAPLHPAQLFFEPLQGAIDTGSCLVGLAVRLNLDPRSDMHRTVGPIAMPFLGDDDAGLDRIREIFRNPMVQPVADVRPQRFIDIEMLSLDEDLHV